jgi:hypothetical protein
MPEKNETRITLRMDRELKDLLQREADKQGLKFHNLLLHYIQTSAESQSYYKLNQFAENSRYLISQVIFISSLLRLKFDKDTIEAARQKTTKELIRLGLREVDGETS